MVFGLIFAQTHNHQTLSLKVGVSVFNSGFKKGTAMVLKYLSRKQSVLERERGFVATIK